MNYIKNWKIFESIQEIEKQYPVGTKFKNLKHPQTQTIKKYEDGKVFIDSSITPGRLFEWPAEIIPDMIKNAELQVLNESLFTALGIIFFGGLLLIKLLKFLASKVLSKAQGVLVSELLKKAKLLSAGKTGKKNSQGEMEWRDGLNVYEFADRYVIRSSGGMFDLGDDVKIMKTEKLMIWGKYRITLSDSDYEKFLSLIKEKL